MIIGCDIDGVLADFNTAFIQRVIDVTGKDLFPARPFDISTWNYPQAYGYTEAEVSSVWENVKADYTFWERLPPYEDTRQSLASLDQLDADVYFVTARPGVEAKQQTERWLRYYGAYRPTVCISSFKGLVCSALNIDGYIDDRWENALDVARTDTQSYMLVRPWNRGNNPDGFGIQEVASVADFLSR